MISLKRGVRVLGLRPELLLAVVVTESVYASLGHALVITSAIDGTHMRASEHYTGLAFDGRLNNLEPIADRATIAAAVRVALGADYDVIHESPGTTNEHLHVQYNPKDPL